MLDWLTGSEERECVRTFKGVIYENVDIRFCRNFDSGANLRPRVHTQSLQLSLIIMGGVKLRHATEKFVKNARVVTIMTLLY